MPAGVRYGYTLRWTARDGTRTVRTSEAETPELAVAAAVYVARAAGWTPPRWWQFWRWRDSRPPEVPPLSAPAGRPDAPP